MKSNFTVVVTLVILLYLMASSSLTRAEKLVVIANPPANFDGFSQDHLSSFIMLRSQSANGHRVSLYMPRLNSARFWDIALELRLQPFLVERWWDRAKYAGMASTPQQLAHDDDIIKAVTTHKNSLGIVSQLNCMQKLCANHIIMTLDNHHE